MLARIFSAVETCESLTVENQINRFVLTMMRSFWNRDLCMFKGTTFFKSGYALLHLLILR